MPKACLVLTLCAVLFTGNAPASDTPALATAYKNLKGLSQRPGQAELSEIAKVWRPHRATAARLLWHYYLSGMKHWPATQK